MNRTQIKAQARQALGNNIFASTWLMMLLVLLIENAILSVGSVIAFLIAGPLAYGVSTIFLNVVRNGEDINFGNLFKGFTNHFIQTFLLSLIQSLFIALWSLLFVIPGIVKSYAYSMSFFIKADNPDYDWKQCLDESIRITKGHKMELFMLDLSFIGWYIVGALCFGIGTLWVTPYHSTSKALYYEQLKNADNAEFVA